METFHPLRFRRLRWEIDSIIESLDRYLDFIRSGIIVEQKKHEEFLDDLEKKAEPDELPFLHQFYGDETKNIENEFPRRAYSSFIVAWYSTYEETLLGICKFFDLKLTIGPFDPIINVKGIYRGRAFLRMSINYEIAKPDWDELNLIRQIRNSLVHEGGEFKAVIQDKQGDSKKLHEVKNAISGVTVLVEMREELFKYVEFYDLLKFDPPRFRLHPEGNFCKHLIRFATKSLNRIINDLEQAHTEGK